MAWKTSLPLLIILIDSDAQQVISEEIKTVVFLIISVLAFSYWINKISNEYLKVQDITWQQYLGSTFKVFIQGFKKKDNGK